MNDETLHERVRDILQELEDDMYVDHGFAIPYADVPEESHDRAVDRFISLATEYAQARANAGAS